jgi:hypothetical protein
MPVFEQKRDRMIEYLEAALVLADDLKDSATGYNVGEWERERPSHAVTAAPSNCVNGLDGGRPAALLTDQVMLALARLHVDRTACRHDRLPERLPAAERYPQEGLAADGPAALE